MRFLLAESCAIFLAATLPVATATAIEPNQPGNRLTYLDESDPFYPHRNFPKLITPQWIGEPGVDAVVILAVDDMQETGRYETFLRPILERLKQIDGRAPVSIMTIAVPTNAPNLQLWLQEGLSLEVHTLTHPCPLLQKGNFESAASVVHGGVELLGRIPGNNPMAFRMPCCDSMNSPSPRFYAEIFNRTSTNGHFLTIDSSVMNLMTAADDSVPKSLMLDAEGRERFRKYLPAQTNAVTQVSMGSFATTIENYPFPYVIGKLCWEFPAVVPSDWEARNIQNTNNPVTVADWKAALEVIVRKQGAFNLIFHPHGWIRSDQIVELIDHADKTYGRRVRFLTFREAQERLNRHLLAGNPLRDERGDDNGVRILDVNNDGFMDVIIGNGQSPSTRIWQPKEQRWMETPFPTWLVATSDNGRQFETGARFGIFGSNNFAGVFVRSSLIAGKFGDGRTNNPSLSGAWSFNGTRWEQDLALLEGMTMAGKKIFTARNNRDEGVRFRDLDHDGRCEVLVSNPRQNVILGWSVERGRWQSLAYSLPKDVTLVNEEGSDNGVRFVDVNHDGYDDVLLSNERAFSLHLFIEHPKPHLGWEKGWSFQARSGRRGDPREIPMIVRGGSSPNNGAWFRNGVMWVQNEDTANLPDKVDRRSFAELIGGSESAPRSATDSLKEFEVAHGFKIELVAHEPMIVDPVAFDWDADGRLWVVEMNDYPSGNGGKGGQVKVLEDVDGDGHYDRVTVFLDHLNFPNGIMPWRRGALISAAPDIIYAEDSDGDGRADVRRILLQGFREGNQQHRVNGFEYGLDNWVYAANGDSSGSIRPVLKVDGSEAGGDPVDLRGHDLRFNPDTGELSLIPGQTQFGRHRDDWGNWFGNNNPTWLWHYHLPEHYLARNPSLAVRSTRRTLANYPDATRIFSISTPQPRFNWVDAVRQVTSANSATPYRDELFGDDHLQSVFISEPANNVVHREVLDPETNGVSFTSHRARGEEQREFIASKDNWFRPTMLKTGPDGALYIADMYRMILEHPEYFPDELKTRPDLRNGDDRGRIYRVYPEQATLRRIPRLGKLGVPELVAALNSANGWERDTAQRLLVERKEASAALPLAELLQTASRPQTRLHALCTLDGLRAVTPEVIIAALRDAHPAVREQAIRIAEPLLPQWNRDARYPELVQGLKNCLRDPSMRVRYQLAFSLGEWRGPGFEQMLAELAARDGGNPDMQTAILSSASSHASQVLLSVVRDSRSLAKDRELIVALARMMDPALDAGKMREVFDAVPRRDVSEQFAVRNYLAEGILDRLADAKMTLAQWSQSSPTAKPASSLIRDVLEEARRFARTADRDEEKQLSAVRLLGREKGDLADAEILVSFLEPQHSDRLQQAALDRLKQVDPEQVAGLFIARWQMFLPRIRDAAANFLLGNVGSSERLLEALEKGTVQPGEIALAHRQRLLRHADSGLRQRAQRIFDTPKIERQKVLRNYEQVSALNPNPGKGAELFRQQCATCHRFRNEGVNVGPDLGSVSDKTIAEIVTSVLDPNQTVDAAFLNYTVRTRQGRELSGIMTAETPNSVTLRAAGGTDEVILRRDIEELRSSGLSPMPEGFENLLTPQDLADLIGFLKSPE